MVIFVVSSTPMYVPWVLVIGVRAVRSPVTKVLENRWDLKTFWTIEVTNKKRPLYCPQGSGTLRQQLLMMHGN